MRKPYIAGNWKMNTTVKEGSELAQELAALITQQTDSDVAIFPPATHLAPLSSELAESPIQVGSQTISSETSGAFTGEISAKMVHDIGCPATLIGHSERRQLFQETNEMLAKKCEQALQNNLQIVYCVGETLEERESNQTLEIIESQISEGLGSVKGQLTAETLIIAYEPVWAIGTGKVATPEQAQEVHRFIRELLGKWHSQQLSENTRILYGGSVKAENSAELLSQRDIDGALVGGAALNAQGFYDIIQSSYVQA